MLIYLREFTLRRKEVNLLEILLKKLLMKFVNL